MSTPDVRVQDNKRGVLLTTSLVSSLIMLDSNIVAVSLPDIARSLHASFHDIEWVISAYLLSYAALLLAAGAFSDRFGRRGAMLIGLLVFAISSFACGQAKAVWVLDLARAIQGMGGAMLLTAALAIITHTFTDDAERAHAFAIWGACLGIALASGPILGGYITKLWGWEWVFLINVPACGALIVATIGIVDESKDPDAKALDFGGIATFSPGLFLLVWALIDGNEAGWTSISIVGRLIVAMMFFVAFVLVESRHPRPMVDLTLFRRPVFVGAVTAMTGYGATAQVMVFFLPVVLQNAYGFEPEQAGLAMIPFAVPMVVAPRLTARYAGSFSSRTVLTAGLLLTTMGNAAFWAIAKGHLSYPVFIVGMLIAGSGAGILNGETVKAIGATIPPERAGMASGLASITRFIGILMGVTLLGAVLSGIARDRFIEQVASLGLDRAALANAAQQLISGNLSAAVNFVNPDMKKHVLEVGLSAFLAGFGAASLLAAALSLIAAALSYHYLRDEAVADAAAMAVAPHGPCLLVDCRHPI